MLIFKLLGWGAGIPLAAMRVPDLSPTRGVAQVGCCRDHSPNQPFLPSPIMNEPIPPRPLPPVRDPLSDSRLTTWSELQHELAELHARLEYFRLLLNLSARRAQG
jgi:hypothetical protein